MWSRTPGAWHRNARRVFHTNRGAGGRKAVLDRRGDGVNAHTHPQVRNDPRFAPSAPSPAYQETTGPMSNSSFMETGRYAH